MILKVVLLVRSLAATGEGFTAPNKPSNSLNEIEHEGTLHPATVLN